MTFKICFQTDCYAGCPCEAYQCEPDKKSLLVLNTRGSNKPVLIKYDGGEDPNLEFTMGPDTSVHGSCSTTLNDEFYVFGGEGIYNRQVFCQSKNAEDLINDSDKQNKRMFS